MIKTYTHVRACVVHVLGCGAHNLLEGVCHVSK